MESEPMTDSNWHDFREWLQSLSLDDVILAHRMAQNELLEAIRRTGTRTEDADAAA